MQCLNRFESHDSVFFSTLLKNKQAQITYSKTTKPTSTTTTTTNMFFFSSLLYFTSNFIHRIENRSTIPDVYLSKTIPKTNSPHQMPLLSTASQPNYHQQSQPSTSASESASASFISFSNTINASNEPAKTNSSTSGHAPLPLYCNEMEQRPTAEENDSTAILIPSTSLIGRNGIKSNSNPLNLIQFGENASNTINTGDNSNNDYCNTSNSGTGEAKAYKLLNSLS